MNIEWPSTGWLCICALCAWSCTWLSRSLSATLEDASYKTPIYDNAERPPLQIVPGQRDGENKKAQVAKRKQPNPRPALCWLRRDEGCAKKIAATEEAIDRVLNAIAVSVMGGDVERIPEETTAKVAVRMPAARVMLPSAGQATRGDAATNDQDVLDVAVVGSGVACELEDAREGNGEGNRIREHANARYPVTRSEEAALNVMPEKSRSAASTTTKSDAFLAFVVCAQSFSDGLSAVSVCVMLAATATSRIRPVRRPPIWVAA